MGTINQSSLSVVMSKEIGNTYYCVMLKVGYQYYFQMGTNERKITSFPCDYWFKECKIYVMLFMFAKEETQRARGVKEKKDITSKCTNGKENLA